MNVPSFDLTRQTAGIKAELDAAIAQVLASGHFILGENVLALEREIAAYCGVEYGIGVANGSDALHLALVALGIGPGDEVIVPAFTFFATAGAVARAGATPVFADVDPVSMNIDPASVRRCISAKTKGIILVHLFGNPADMDSIMAIAREHNLKVVEDGAQAIGATYHERKVGSFGDVATFSFFPTKNLGAFGDGGMVVTSDPQLRERVACLRAHGAKRKYYHEEFGYNSRLDELQAAILRVKFRYLEAWTDARRQKAELYRTALAGAGLVLPCESADTRHVYHQYTVQVPNRDEFVEFLRQRGIGTAVYYPLGLHLQPALAPFGAGGVSLPVTERLTSTVVSLPMFPELTQDEVEFVAASVKEWGLGGKAC